MSNRSYRQDESLMSQDQNQTQEIDDQVEQILPQEDNQIDQLDETQNITFNFANTKTFKIEIPDYAKLISLRKFYFEEFKQLLTRLELNFNIVKEGLIIKTEAEENYHQGIQNEILKYLKTIYTIKLALDYDSQRTFFRSNFILNQCAKLEYYIVKQKNCDQIIEIYLVSKKDTISIVAHNLQQKLKGLRLFFQDVVNHMTSTKVNIDYKNLLGTLRQRYFKEILSENLEKQFSNLEFLDVIDKQQPYSSVLLGFQFPFDLKGKTQLCQEIYQYIKKTIEQLFIVFISFDSLGDNLKQARYIENLITNFRENNNRFVCVCQVDLSLKVIAILGTPEGIKIIVNEVLKEKKDKFSKEFFRTMAVNVLRKNFEFNPTNQIGSFETQITGILMRRNDIDISSIDQLYTIKFLSKVTFESYCNLLTFICDKKIEQDKEKVLNIELKRISSKITELNLVGKFFEQLEIMPAQIQNQNHNHNKNQNHNQNQNFRQSQNKNQSFQQKQQIIDQPISQQKVPQDQNANNQQKIDSVVDKKEHSNEILQVFLNNNNQYIENSQVEEKIIFDDPIVQEIYDGTGRIKINEKYQQYFKQLIGENNKPLIGFICITEKDLMSLKFFKKEMKIYQKNENIERSQNEIIIQVEVNGNAEKMKIFEQQKNYEEQIYFEQQNKSDSFYMVNQDNQILPVQKIEI